MDHAEVEQTKQNFDAIWDQVRNSVVAFGFTESAIEAMSVSAEERNRIFQENWDKGNGFRFMFGTFADIATNPEANEAAAAFIRSKIAEIVKDPETARKLTPTGLYAKRPLCNEGYYETFNRHNVSLVSLKETPIEEITPRGVRTADGVEHELDVLVFATGFDAVDGNYRSMDLRGRGEQHIDEHWDEAPTSYLGVTTAGFPNMFMILGPNGPFTNLPPSIETQVEFIIDLIQDAERKGGAVVEAAAEAEDGWTATCNEIAHMTLFPKAESWIFGANIPGKKNAVMFFMGGLGQLPRSSRGRPVQRLQGFPLHQGRGLGRGLTTWRREKSTFSHRIRRTRQPHVALRGIMLSGPMTDKPGWRRAYDTAERAVAPRAETLVRSSEFAGVTAAVVGLAACRRPRSERCDRGGVTVPRTGTGHTRRYPARPRARLGPAAVPSSRYPERTAALAPELARGQFGARDEGGGRRHVHVLPPKHGPRNGPVAGSFTGARRNAGRDAGNRRSRW